MHDAWVLSEGHDMVHMLLTRRTDEAKRKCSRLRVDQWGRPSSKSVDCDIWAQGCDITDFKQGRLVLTRIITGCHYRSNNA
jgi:hypothetical protein